MISNIFRLPYQKIVKDPLTEETLFCTTNTPTYQAQLADGQGYVPLKRLDVYPVVADFDKHECFSQPSPIQIIDKKEGGIFVFCNLYDSPKNTSYIKDGTYAFYYDGQPYHMIIRG